MSADTPDKDAGKPQKGAAQDPPKTGGKPKGAAKAADKGSAAKSAGKGDAKPAAKKPAAKKPAADKAATKDKAPAKSKKSDAMPELDIPKGAAPTPEERAARTGGTAGASGEARPVRAVAKYLRFSARKGRLVVDQIRGKSVGEARATLKFSPRAAARDIQKVLNSAVANAENNHGLIADDMYVSSVFVDEGPVFRRWKPRARGRVDRIQKGTCHVTIVLDAAPEEGLGRSRREGAGVGRADTQRAARVAASRKKAAAASPTTESSSAATAVVEEPLADEFVEEPARQVSEEVPAEATNPEAAAVEAADDASDETDDAAKGEQEAGA